MELLGGCTTSIILQCSQPRQSTRTWQLPNTSKVHQGWTDLHKVCRFRLMLLDTFTHKLASFQWITIRWIEPQHNFKFKIYQWGSQRRLWEQVAMQFIGGCAREVRTSASRIIWWLTSMSLSETRKAWSRWKECRPIKGQRTFWGSSHLCHRPRSKNSTTTTFSTQSPVSPPPKSTDRSKQLKSRKERGIQRARAGLFRRRR